ncbi:hypothetical protein ACRQ5D_26360 [Mucilaginibacter sp. P25]|uniref:Uncharacterized protein n=1 Tax=Mucilaginibacter gossypii TaxID=551996 RepID=A0A1G7PZ47_9SPHI|nr:hypothetical protein [Mucilaginibacter gossypii]SDF91488.1 hypothetical protein SAMN05192573_101722 [Mucilaginibacter gossypii]
MYGKKSYPLISGKFNSNEALSIIMSFYNHKINYHNIQLLGAMEHNDSSVSAIEQKLKSLQNTREEIRKLLTDGIEGDHQVEVMGYIEIDLNS